MRYSIDTSALIEAWQRLYPIDVVPALWDGFDELIGDGHLRATEEVALEIERKEDGLHRWVTARPALVVEIDSEIQLLVQQILSSHPKLLDTRKNRSGGDP